MILSASFLFVNPAGIPGTPAAVCAGGNGGWGWGLGLAHDWIPAAAGMIEVD